MHTTPVPSPRSASHENSPSHSVAPLFDVFVGVRKQTGLAYHPEVVVVRQVADLDVKPTRIENFIFEEACFHSSYYS